MLPSSGRAVLPSLALAVAPLTRIASVGNFPPCGASAGRSCADSDAAPSIRVRQANLWDIVVPPWQAASGLEPAACGVLRGGGCVGLEGSQEIEDGLFLPGGEVGGGV